MYYFKYFSIGVWVAIGGTHSGIEAIANYIGAVPQTTGEDSLTKFMIGCENVEKLPIINIVINGQVFPLHGEDYVLVGEVVDAKQNLCEAALFGADYGVFFY